MQTLDNEHRVFNNKSTYITNIPIQSSASSTMLHILLKHNSLVGKKMKEFLLRNDIIQYLQYVPRQPSFTIVVEPKHHSIPLCVQCKSLPIQPLLIFDIKRSYSPMLLCKDCCSAADLVRHPRIDFVDHVIAAIEKMQVQCVLCNMAVCIGPAADGLFDHVLKDCGRMFHCDCGVSYSLSQFALHINGCSSKRVSCQYSVHLSTQFPTNRQWCQWIGSESEAAAHKLQCTARRSLHRQLHDLQYIPAAASNIIIDGESLPATSIINADEDSTDDDAEMEIKSVTTNQQHLTILKRTVIKTKQSMYNNSHVHVILSCGVAVRFKLVQDSCLLFVSIRDLSAVAQALRFTAFSHPESLIMAQEALREHREDYLSTELLPTCVNTANGLPNIRLDNTKCQLGNIMVSKNFVIHLIQCFRGPKNNNKPAQEFALYLEKIVLPLMQPNHSYKNALKQNEMIVLISTDATTKDVN